MSLAIAQNQINRVNQMGNFRELSVGAGSSIFKMVNPWVWGGGVKPATATFKIYLPTGALTTTGTINATGGTISGDLTVSGSLLSDDGSTFQTKIALGKVSFLKNDVEKAFIKTASDSASLQCATGSYFYITALNGGPLLSVDQSSNLAFSTNSTISWAGGRKITADNSNMTADGGWLVLGKVRSTGYVYRSGTTDYDGADDNDIYVADSSGGSPTKRLRFRGGILTVS